MAKKRVLINPFDFVVEMKSTMAKYESPLEDKVNQKQI